MLRVVTSTFVVGLGSVVFLGAYLTVQIRDGLVDAKVQNILTEAARDAASAETKMDSATALSPADLQQLVNDLVNGLRMEGDEDRQVVLLQEPGNQGAVLLTDVQSDAGAITVISDDMRAAVETRAEQSWQYVLTTTGEPGVVVGSPLRVPVAGDFELYFVYSLANENHTLAFIQRILGLGGIGLFGLVVFMTWSVTLQAVRPVRQAARVASRLAEGMLDERMTIHGHDEMATLARTFNEMAESLQRQITRMEEMSRLQRRFVSDVSHELRTPLTTIRIAADVLHSAKDTFPPEVARSAELLTMQLDRFETLLADLLEISRIDAGAVELDFEEVDLLAVVRDEVETIAPAAKSVGVTIRLWAASGEHTATMDQSRVGRIVRNLLANAVEYAQRGPVDVLVGSNSRGVAVVVRDYGLGMTHQEAERVFDRFWRADASRRRTMGGTGLGLSIAREDALLHGGKLEAWGGPLQGASFRLTLPRSGGRFGTRPVLPLVPHQEDFASLGKRIPLTPAEERSPT